MNDNIYSNITGESIGDITENIEHSIVQYVDDTNNIISSKQNQIHITGNVCQKLKIVNFGVSVHQKLRNSH